MKKRKIIFITSAIIVLTALVTFSIGKPGNAQIITKKNNGNDTLKTNPKIDIKVEKEYGDNGNVIRYDSSYTYIYTYPDGNMEELNMDSIFKNFEPYFFDHGFDIMHGSFRKFFEEDTFYQRHFFDDDFFMQQFENEMFHFEEMMREMDSLRNRFLRENYPDFETPSEPAEKTKIKGIEI